MTEAYYLTLVSAAAIILSLMVIDPNVSVWIDLQYKLFVVNLRKWIFMATMYPRLRYNAWKMKRALTKIRKDYNLPLENEHGDV